MLTGPINHLHCICVLGIVGVGLLEKFAQFTSIDQVSGASCLKLIFDEVLGAQYRYGNFSELCFRAIGPGIIEFDTADLGEDVDPTRRKSRLNPRPQVRATEPQRPGSLIHSTGVVRRRLHPYVDIAGGAGSAVDGKGISTHD